MRLGWSSVRDAARTLLQPNRRLSLKRNLYFIINQRDKWKRFKRCRFSSNILETTLGRKGCVKNCATYRNIVISTDTL